MRERRGEMDFFEEAVGPEGGGQLGAQHLQCDVAVVSQVAREKHHRHPAPPDFPFDPIPPTQGIGDTTAKIGHGHSPSLGPSGRNNNPTPWL